MLGSKCLSFGFRSKSSETTLEPTVHVAFVIQMEGKVLQVRLKKKEKERKDIALSFNIMLLFTV